MLQLNSMPAFFGRGLPTLSTSTPQQQLQLSSVARNPSSESSSGISSIPHTARTTSALSMSSGVHSLTRDQTPSTLVTASSLTTTLSRRDEENKFQAPGMRTLEEYRKKTNKDNIENSKMSSKHLMADNSYLLPSFSHRVLFVKLMVFRTRLKANYM